MIPKIQMKKAAINQDQESFNILREQMWVYRHSAGEGKVRWDPEYISDDQWGGESPEWGVLEGRRIKEDATVAEMTLNFWRLSFRKWGTWGHMGEILNPLLLLIRLHTCHFGFFSFFFFLNSSVQSLKTGFLFLCVSSWIHSDFPFALIVSTRNFIKNLFRVSVPFFFHEIQFFSLCNNS